MKRLVEELRAALPAAFEREEYRSQRESIEHEFKERHQRAFSALQGHAERSGVALLRTTEGLGLAPKRDGNVLSPDQFGELPLGTVGRWLCAGPGDNRRAQFLPARDPLDIGPQRPSQNERLSE